MNELRYIELKTGYSDDGPAWIGKVKLSKSKNALYFNDKAFHKCKGISGNYIDVETSEECWISGVKKNGEDRHWAGHGKIAIDRKVIEEYLDLTGQSELDSTRLEAIDIPDIYPVDRINKLLNNAD